MREAKGTPSISIPADLVQVINKIAKEEHRSFRGQCEWFIKEGLLIYREVEAERKAIYSPKPPEPPRNVLSFPAKGGA